MKYLKAVAALPDYEDNLIHATALTIDAMVTEIKSKPFKLTLYSRDYLNSLPEVLSKLEPIMLNALLRAEGTIKFFKILSNLSGIRFEILTSKGAPIDTRVYIKNLNWDLVNNANPSTIPGQPQQAPIGSLKPDVLKNLNPDKVNNVTPLKIRNRQDILQEHEDFRIVIKGHALDNPIDKSNLKKQVLNLVEPFLPVGSNIYKVYFLS